MGGSSSATLAEGWVKDATGFLERVITEKCGMKKRIHGMASATIIYAMADQEVVTMCTTPH